MSDLADATRAAVMGIYHKHGLAATDKKIKELLSQCEHSNYSAYDRGAIKGELSENALECHLLRLTELVPGLTCVKSLCIKSQTSNATAEIDIMLITAYRIYLFECKSFKGSKTLTNECYLKGGSSEKDVFDQSKYHLEILNQYLAGYRMSTNSKVSPYKLILFELSSDEVKDIREDKWKKNIPLLTIDTFDDWMIDELSKDRVPLWDVSKVLPCINKLNSTSEQMFKFHMKKIMNRKK